MTQEQINEICNKNQAEGKMTYALVYASGEMKEYPETAWDIFYNDHEPEIRELFNSKEAVLKCLSECGEAYASNYGYRGKRCDCRAYLACGMSDINLEGDTWSINLDILSEISPLPPVEDDDEGEDEE